MQGRAIRHVVVVGGGTAGWMTAAYLNRWLSKFLLEPGTVTLVESADIGTIGVGEATIPTLKDFLSFLGLREREFMVRTNAGFKNAIKFVNWRDDPRTYPNHHYYHPFEIPLPVAGLPLSHYWLARRLRGDGDEDYAYSASMLPWICDRGLSPKIASSRDYRGLANYAYHLDAVLFGRYLRDVALERGVRHMVDDVVDVHLDERGFVRAVRTANHGELEGEMFIDCTGFRGRIINQVLETPFVDYTDVLFCDRAVALQVPYDPTNDPVRPNPFTTATAMSAGWIWEIHLAGPQPSGQWGRRGIGYVYSSQFISDDDAETELRRYIGPAAEGRPARRLKLRVGRNARLWVKNCLSVGLAGGFVEPLESTGIYLIEVGLRLLTRHFPTKDFPPSVSERYNELMSCLYEEIRDFIALHYCITQREDTPFWRANKYNGDLSEKLKIDLDLWRRRPPMIYDIDNSLKFFRAESYTYILYGMNHLPDWDHFVGPPVRPERAGSQFAEIKARTQQALAESLDHGSLLRQLHAESPNLDASRHTA